MASLTGLHHPIMLVSQWSLLARYIMVTSVSSSSTGFTRPAFHQAPEILQLVYNVLINNNF